VSGVAVTKADNALERIRAIVGNKGVTTDAAEIAPFVADERGRYRGASPMLVRPATAQDVAAVVAVCAENTLPIVPQGGNTSLCGGSVPHADGGEIVLNLSRLNRIRDIDPLNYTMTVEAGCVLADLQAAAEEADRLFPLSLGAEGSCRIGGNLSTNAGGTNVLRYGMARELVLGLEVVLPDGTLWNGLRALRKDNTGYDLKQLFIGGEGTLGIITAAVLKLFPRPRDTQTAWLAVRDLDAALELLVRAREASGDRVTAFELITRRCLDFVLAHTPGTSDPLAEPHETYVLIEFSSSEPESGLRQAMEGLFAAAFEDGIVVDGVLAESMAQGRDLWRLRESITESQKFEGGSIKHDISVPVSRVPEFVRRATELVEKELPACRPLAFGHVGDGNVHFNISQPVGADKAAFLGQWERVNRLVHDLVFEMNGSFSAEHGIGQLKREALLRYKPAIEVELMRRVKQAIDPQGIMNPGKIL
jgi:FAD/FMN-containing dehydrogenase